MDTKKMRVCAPLLPPPGDEVVVECLNEIERLREALSQFEKLREALTRIADRYHNQPECFTYVIAKEALDFKL